MNENLSGASEAQVSESIKNLLDSLGIYWFRVNSGKGARIHNRWVELAPAGTPDIVSCILGKFIGIECKRPRGGRQSEAQKLAQAKIEAAGGVYLLCNTAEPLSTLS